MQVTVQYALTHFDDLSSAVDRGEDVEILRPGKLGLHLVPASPIHGDETIWKTAERPRSELFGSLKGKLGFADDWDSAATNDEIADLFEGTETARDAVPR